MSISVFLTGFCSSSRHVPFLICTVWGISWLLSAQGTAADFHATLSARETYVGEQVVFKLEVEDSGGVEPPKIPEVEGLDIRALGGPQHLQQTLMINGRVSQRVSTTWSYSVTPTRVGEFEIPPISTLVDGELCWTPRLELVASVSETGDLLYVEVEGGQEQVFVGEPLELTLKIWVRPYRDREYDLTLEESDMWSAISSRSSWGSFLARVEELANDRKRPRGREVLRQDIAGTNRSYYLYEISTTIYPRRPGQIDAGDVNIVVNYPVKMARSRDRMSDFLNPSVLGNSSFGSIFGPGIRVTQTRPIEAAAGVDTTLVTPIPTEGRPDTYQGAVGRYQITARTNTEATRAGDPITLQIAIQGDGPLELVQSPPLRVLDKDFRVDQQPLAGFVQDGSKYFTTTVRPRDTSVTEIPSIEMSFFDPQTETFQTVATQPIPIEVGESETLLLDAIVSDPSENRDDREKKPSADASSGLSLSGLMFQNETNIRVLTDQSPQSVVPLALFFVFIPLLCFSMMWLTVNRSRLRSPGRLFRSRRQQVIGELRAADTRDAIANVLVRYVSSLGGNGSSAGASDWLNGLGFLRFQGQSILAAELETLEHDCRRETRFDDSQKESLLERAIDWVRRVETVRRSGWRWTPVRRDEVLTSKSGGAADKKVIVLRLILCSAACGCVPCAWAAEAGGPTLEEVVLDPSQKSALFAEANELYTAALTRSPQQDDEQGFARAAEKYQQLVDSGVRHSDLLGNLGNARFQAGQVGRAIASFRRAQSRAPLSPRIQVNLLWAQINAGVPISQYRLPLVAFGMLAIGSVCGWVCLSLRCIGSERFFRRRILLARSGVVFLVIFLLGGFLLIRETIEGSKLQAIAIVDELSIRSGDGEAFETVASLGAVQGRAFDVTTVRGDWLALDFALDFDPDLKNGESGWVHADDVELVSR